MIEKFIVFIKTIGIDPGVLVAGIWGAVASLRNKSDLNWWERVLTFVTGTASAVYLTPIFGNFFEFNQSGLYGISFLLGLGGLKSSELLLQSLHEGVKVKIGK